MSSSTDKNGNINNSSSNKHSLLDRTIPIVLPVAALDKDTTPSRKHGVSVQLERLHRLQGTSLISMGIHILQQQPSSASTEEATAATAATSPISYSPTSWYASACTIFHRYYHGVSLLQRDVWSVAMASTLIAAKLEEIPLTVRQLIIVYAHLYTRRRHVVIMRTSTTNNDVNDDNAMNMLFQKIINHPEVLVANCISEKSSSRRRTILNKPDGSCVQALSPTGPIWKEWHEALLQTESSILRQLGFVIHWIPNRHVHKLVYAFLHVLQIAPTTTTTARTASTSAAENTNDSNNHDADDDDRHRLAQGVWNYCNLSYRLDLCCRFEAPVIACAAIYLAALDLGFDVDQDLHVVVKSLVSHNANTKTTTATMNHHPWWKILLLGTAAVTDNAQVEKMATDLIQIANTLAGLAAASTAVSADASKDDHHGSSGNNRSGDDDDDDDKLGVDQNQLDVLVASVAFLKPLNQDSFHGPDSFVWEMANRHDAATATATATATTATR